MKKKTPRKDFTEIMDLSAEIGLQISVSNLMNPKSLKDMDSATYTQEVVELLKLVDKIAAKINEIAYKNI